MVMVVEKVPAAWLVEIVTSLSHAVEGVTAVPLSSSPQRIFTVGFCPPVLFNTPVSTAVSREGWFTLIAPKPAGMMVWAMAAVVPTSEPRVKRRALWMRIDLMI